MKNGIYYDFPENDYHASTAISCSGLKEILRKSPRHYQYKYLEGGSGKESQALNFGKAAHMALLEPERFDVTYVTAPDCNLSTKEGCLRYNNWLAHITETTAVAVDVDSIKDLRRSNEELLAAFTGSIITAKDMQIITGIMQSIKDKPATHKLMTMQGKREVTIFWDEQGISCRARLDLVADKGIIADFKSTATASPMGFQRQAYGYDYHMQAYWYQRGWQKVTGETLLFVFIPAEKEPPYCVAAYQADKDMLDLGAIDCMSALSIYEQCLESGKFHDYPDTITPLGLPKWAENRLTYGD